MNIFSRPRCLAPQQAASAAGASAPPKNPDVHPSDAATLHSALKPATNKLLHEQKLAQLYL